MILPSWSWSLGPFLLLSLSCLPSLPPLSLPLPSPPSLLQGQFGACRLSPLLPFFAGPEPCCRGPFWDWVVSPPVPLSPAGLLQRRHGFKLACLEKRICLMKFVGPLKQSTRNSNKTYPGAKQWRSIEDEGWFRPLRSPNESYSEIPFELRRRRPIATSLRACSPRPSLKPSSEFAEGSPKCRPTEPSPERV